MSAGNRIKHLFDLYTSDLSYSEIEKLIKRDSAEVYEFFTANIPKSDPNENKLRRGFKFFKGLFNAFVLRLTPARRILYFLTLLFFFVGINSLNTLQIFLSFVVLNLLLAFELADKLTLKSEIDIASKVQNGLVPNSPPKHEIYDIAIHYEPAKIVSGDYFDFISTNNNDMYYFIGDISGKGMSAALFMVQVRSIIHSLVNLCSSPKEVLIKLKEIFSKDLKPGTFLTIVSALVKTDGSISISRAGHNTIYYYKKETKEIEILFPKGLAIGFNDKGTFASSLEEILINPVEGDLIIFYTDGITEAMNEKNEQFGENRFKDEIIKNADKNVDELKDRIIRAISRFRGTSTQSDDLTLTILKHK